jgi:hypothetical protein
MNTLGLIAIASGGTPVQITATSIGAITVTFQPKPGNAGVVYVGRKAMNTGTGANVLGVIPKPASATTGPFQELTLPPTGTGSGGYRLDELYIDGTTGDGVYVRYT